MSSEGRIAAPVPHRPGPIRRAPDPMPDRHARPSSRRPLAELRSQRWFAARNMRGFAHRQRTQQMGMRREHFLGKPVIAIVDTWSDLSPCHAQLRERAEAVKRGVRQAGGYPVALPALSVGEVMVKPTTMLYRNFLAMETEELLRSHPVADDELARRRAAWAPPARRYERGYVMLYREHVTRADAGCDFDFLETGTAKPVPEPDIH